MRCQFVLPNLVVPLWMLLAGAGLAMASAADHWAFHPPLQPPIPEASDKGWPSGELDHFILATLEKERLHPSPSAHRATLLRRLSLDLIGLPPTPRELDTFTGDTSSNAYENQVDRLLASEHFGEKWARHWLDEARYADSDGYEKDLPRKQWVWRDWVIRAFNSDMPYDRFLIEQIAGDLLAGATQEQRIATGFLRNSMVNEEGAIVAEQFRMEGLIDRMDCIGKGILGLTIQCAQCHNHKFDPLTQEEYYRMMAFLNNDYEATSWVYSPAQLDQIGKIQRGTAELEQKIRSGHPDWALREVEWEAQARSSEIGWETLKPIDPEWEGGLAHPQVLPDDSVLTLGFRPTDGDMIIRSELKRTGITGLRLETLTHGDLPFNGPGRSYKGTFAISELFVEAMAADGKDDKWQKLKLKNATADFEQPDQPIESFFRKGDNDKRRVGPASYLIDGKEETAWGTDRGPGRRHQDLKAVVQFDQPVSFPQGAKLRIILRFKHGGANGDGPQNNFLGRLRFSVTTAAEPKADPLPRRVRELLVIAGDQRTPEQQAAVFSYWRTTVPEFKPVNEQIEQLWSQFPEGETTILNLARRKPEDARKTFILDRGNWQQPTKAVTPGVPAFLHSLPPGADSTRLTFARWLADRRSPTTARVAVNRVWQAIFGTGIVETSEDFGTRASEPSHPELLDWLAVQFMEHGWSHKWLIRTIVTSSTYRQSSKLTPELLEKDPHNRLLARGPRFRAEAEAVRDMALSVSGLLDRQVGGESFFPPVPDSLFALSFIDVYFWKTAPPPERYRRSLYVFRRRSMPDPLLACFDAPSGDAACPRRMRSNTPLAALAAMNEPIFVDSARALALRVLREAGKSDVQRAAYAFRLCTSREPKPMEIDEILALYRSRKARLADGWMSAREVATGDATHLPDLPPGVTPTDAAAWTIVSRVLLNLDETLTKQ